MSQRLPCKSYIPFNLQRLQYLNKRRKVEGGGCAAWPTTMPYNILWKWFALICIQTCKIERSERSIHLLGHIWRLGTGRICLPFQRSVTLWCTEASAAGWQFLMKNWGPPRSGKTPGGCVSGALLHPTMRRRGHAQIKEEKELKKKNHTQTLMHTHFEDNNQTQSSGW